MVTKPKVGQGLGIGRLTGRAAVLSFSSSLCQGLMEVLVVLFFSFFFLRGCRGRGEERRASLCLGFPFVHSGPLQASNRESEGVVFK